LPTVIDCRGLAARNAQSELRGVKGELILIETDEVELSRPVRLIHPRFPLYVIPRGDHRFMLGATSIESESSGVSVRSALELLGAAYAVHPAFAEARILEFGSGLRPAFPDNLPRIAVNNDRIAVNGLYRHGFLLAPALAELTLGYVERGTIDNEVMQCA
jgi:glycine oxidase